MDIFENTKSVLTEKKISVADFERELGLAKGSFYKWKDHVPSMITVKKAAEFLNVPIAELVK